MGGVSSRIIEGRGTMSCLKRKRKGGETFFLSPLFQDPLTACFNLVKYINGGGRNRPRKKKRIGLDLG